MGSFRSWAIAAVIGSAVGTAAGAAPIVGFGDPAAHPGVGATVTRTFETVAPGTYGSVTLSGVTITGFDNRGLIAPPATASPIIVNDTYPIYAVADVGPGPFPGFITDGVYHYQVTSGLYNTQGQSLSNGEETLNYTANGDPLLYTTEFVFEIDQPTEYFAFNLGAVDNEWTLTTYDSSRNLLDALTIPPQPRTMSGEYYGAISSVGIAYARLTSSLGFGQEWVNGEMVLLDNITTGRVSSVPVPAGLPMLLGALGAFGLAGWRARAGRAA